LRQRGIEHQLSHYDLYSNDSAAQIAMVTAGLGVGQTHLLVVKRQLEEGTLVAVLEDWNGHPIPISVMYPSAKRMNQRAKVFMDWLARYLKQVDI
jgi:DNA-binding transcriptional LysR family regulator